MAKKKSELLPPPSASDLVRKMEGDKVDAFAKQLYPDGMEITTFNEKGWQETKRLIQAKTNTLFQPTIVAANRLTCRSDILTYDARAKAYEIREVKSSTSVRPEDIEDVAFQRICFKEAGIPVSRTFLIHINGDYVRRGAIDPKQFFVTVDISKEVDEVVDETKSAIAHARKYLEYDELPDRRVIESCTNPKSCAYLKHYLHGVSDHQALTRDLSPRFVIELLKRDIVALESLDKKFVTELGYTPEEKFIDHAAIKSELKELQHPLYFLDYETYSSPIPPFDRTRPWQQIPFQYSLHIQRERDATLEHKEFIATESRNPIADFAKQLQEDIGNRGSVVVWNATFEATRNKEIGKDFPEYATRMKSINARMFDLMVIFRKKLYTQHEFHRSYSIKNILPVLVPELSYKELAIQEGGTASISWPILIDEKTPAPQRDELKKNMLLYCGLDTLAMVRILENLEKEVK
jgi:hypothetical protein